jgi:hypothetical protein
MSLKIESDEYYKWNINSYLKKTQSVSIMKTNRVEK